jgi:hypothetical protein
MDNSPDGVETYPGDSHDLDSYPQAEKTLSRQRTPILLHANDPHERLYFAALDGTGNTMFDDAPEHWSVVANIYQEVDNLRKQGVDNIRGGYVEGTFTQDNPIARYIDGVAGYTFERRVETAYDQFCRQAKDWLREDPDAQIRIIGLGFSRGAEEAAALLRMIEKRGIQDPEDAKYTYHKDGLIKSVEYTRPPLVPPGQTIQAALLFDPVATGVKEHDRRLPPTVMSALQITAEDERRDQFESTNLIEPGFTEGNRFLNITVGGAHSDIGDTYTLNGFGVRSHNLGIDYLNSFSDHPFLAKRAVPDDPAQTVVHRSDQHSWIYTERGYRDGVRNHHDDLAPDAFCRNDATLCAEKEPFDPAMDRRLERRGVPIGPLPAARTQDIAPVSGKDGAELQADMPRSETERLFDRLHRAALQGDNRGMHAVGNDYLNSADGQAWRQDVYDHGRAAQAQELQAAWLVQQQQAVEQPHRSHAMRM